MCLLKSVVQYSRCIFWNPDPELGEGYHVFGHLHLVRTNLCVGDGDGLFDAGHWIIESEAEKKWKVKK